MSEAKHSSPANTVAIGIRTAIRGKDVSGTVEVDVAWLVRLVEILEQDSHADLLAALEDTAHALAVLASGRLTQRQVKDFAEALGNSDSILAAARAAIAKAREVQNG